MEVRRRVWKNLVFTGGPGSGKSRTAAAVGQAYQKLGCCRAGRSCRWRLLIWRVLGRRRRASSWVRRSGWPRAGS